MQRGGELIAKGSVESRAGQGLTEDEARLRLSRDGPNEVPEAPSHPLLRLAGKFWGLSAWMLELVAALSFFLHKAADFSIALALLVVNASLSFFEEQRASAAVAALRQKLRVTARVLREGRWQALPARELVAGDVVRVRTGDFVPADGVILEGGLRVDESSLTGESRELPKDVGAALHSGAVVRKGEATVSVQATGARSFFGRTTHLIESAHPKLHVEEVTNHLVRWLFLIVGALVTAVLAQSLIRGSHLLELLPLSLLLLLSAVPVALPVMFTASTAVGALELGRQGVLVTRLAAVEDAATMDVLCADKTGTLTVNRLSIQSVLPRPGFSTEDVLRAAALASNEANQDAIDACFLRAAEERGLLDAAAKQVTFVPFSAESRRTEADVLVEGRHTRIVKGALRAVAELSGLDAEAIDALEARAAEDGRQGTRVVAVARGDTAGQLRLAGLVFLYDAPRADSRELIERLRSLGVSVKMLTGDGLAVARQIARELGLGDIAHARALRAAEQTAGVAAAAALVGSVDGFAEVFPEDKIDVVKSLQAAGHVVGMTGDGVNDAPALRQAEVGIAVRGGTDVAKGAASVVLTSEGLQSIVTLVMTGRATYQRVLTWVVNKVSQTTVIAGFVVVAFLATGKFVISALGMVLLLFMTDFVKVSLSTDRVHPSQRPESWSIGPLVGVAAVIGVVELAEALALLAFALRHFHFSVGQQHTFSFLTLLFFALFSIVSIRERRFFWASRPSRVLASALAADAGLGLLLSHVGLADLQPLPPVVSALVAFYALLCCLGPNDILKARLVRRFWSKLRGLEPSPRSPDGSPQGGWRKHADGG